MRRIEAVRAVIDALDDQAVVLATGMISREAYRIHDREASFYMLGSMGLCSAIGLGLALAQPARPVLVLDGDGSALMGMGTLASVGELSPGNLVHIVLDNGSYASTGGQRCISDTIRLDGIARAANYRYVSRVGTVSQLEYELERIWDQSLPAFLLAEVEPGNEPDTTRVRLAPVEIKRRFMNAVAISKQSLSM